MMLSLAWRNIWRNKMRSIVIMFSISVGLFAGIAVLALYKGMMKARIRTVIDAESGHLQLHHADFKKDFEPRFVIIGPEEMRAAIEKIPGVKLVALAGPAMNLLCAVLAACARVIQCSEARSRVPAAGFPRRFEAVR